MQRAFSMDRRAVFHRGHPVAVAERFNDAMLMRVLLRFDQVHERELVRPHRPEFPEDLTKLSAIELAELAGINVPPGTDPADAVQAAVRAYVAEVERRMSQESASSGQDNAPGSGQ
ncbi:MAG: hypothetical protein JO339_39355 [Alphaproteobacteria bacterium]|nr:hypothetical protein [Alphaproteobacteria bacterium]